MKKLFLVLLVLGVTLMPLAGCGAAANTSSAPVSSVAQEATPNPTATPEPTATPLPFDIDAYKKMLSDCMNEISTNAMMYYNMCKYEVNYWDALNSVNGTFSSETATQNAMEWLEEETDETAESLSTRHDTITNLYKEISFAEIDGTEAEKLQEVFEEMYDNYCLIYNAAMSPSGDIDSFTSKTNDAVRDFKASKSKLETLLS